MSVTGGISYQTALAASPIQMRVASRGGRRAATFNSCGGTRLWEYAPEAVAGKSRLSLLEFTDLRIHHL